MKYIYIIFFNLLTLSVFSQSFIGFTDNYSGVQSVVFNPANVADNLYDKDFNLFSMYGSIENTNYSIKPFTVFTNLALGKTSISGIYNNLKNGELENIKGIETNPSRNDKYYGNFNILGPSYMSKIDEYSSFAITTGFKNIINSYKINSNFFNSLEDAKNIRNDINSEEDFNEIINEFDITKDNFTQIISMVELGFSYGRIIKQSSNELLKVGASLKLLSGVANYAVFFDDLALDYEYNDTNPRDSKLNLIGQVTNTFSFFDSSFGMGLDVGFVYEKKYNQHVINIKDSNGNIYYKKSPYLFKLGVSITDIGFLNFSNLKTNDDNPNMINIDLTSSNASFNINSYLQIKSNKKINKSYILPTTGRVNFDYNFRNNWFLNTNLDIYMLATNNRNQLKYISNLVITPRYETKNLSVFFPLTANQFGNFKSGIGLRTGYFYLGSSSIFTNFTNLSKAGDVYMGIKIPIENTKSNSKKVKNIKRKNKNVKMKSKRI